MNETAHSEALKLLPFVLIIMSIILSAEFYVNFRWTKFVKRYDWNPWLYRVVWIASGIAITAILVSYAQNLIFANLEGDFAKIVYLWSGMWFLPKIILAPYLLIVNSGSSLVKLTKKAFRRKKAPERGEIKSEKIIKRREFIQTVGWTAAGVPFLASAYGFAVERRQVKVFVERIRIPHLPRALKGFKIAQISDIHAGSFITDDIFRESVEITNSLRPDIVVMTGDFVNSNPSELPLVAPHFSKFKAKRGVYGCLGNHDHYMNAVDHEKTVRIIKNSGVDLLINENRKIRVGEATLQLAGIDNKSHRHDYSDYDRAFSDLDETSPTVLLCHDPINWKPDIVDANRKVDLTLSGHTHGGQISLNILDESFNHVRLLYDHWIGLYQEGDKYLYVNRGLGTTGPPVRLGAPPEVTLIILDRTEDWA